MSTSSSLPALPVGSVGHKASGWYGMLMLIITEASLFAYLEFSYYYYAIGQAPLVSSKLPSFHLSAPNTAILILSSVAVWWGERSSKRGSRLGTLLGLVIGFLLGATFVGIQFMEWSEKEFSYYSSTYGSLYFTITAFHMTHVIVGLLVLAALILWTLLGYFDARRNAPISIGAIYWHFVDAVWITVFFTLYITPYLGLGV